MSENKNKNRGFKFHENVEHFLFLVSEKGQKKMKKEYKKYSKKDRKEIIMGELLECFPEVVWTLTRYSRTPEVIKVKEEIYDVLCDKKFIKLVKESYEEDKDSIKNIKMFPCVIYDMVQTYAKHKAEILKENPKAQVECEEITKLVNLGKVILKSKIKKLVKAGIDEDLAFDLACILPDENMLKYDDKYRIALLLKAIYENAKTKDINIEKVMKVIVTKEYYPRAILTAMLEKRENYANLTEKQQKAFTDITTWTFNSLEDYDKEIIMSIIKKYVDVRKRDKEQNKDSARRLFLSALPESDYPEINKVMKKMIDLDASVEEFF